MFVTMLGCTQWLYLGNCFVCCKADKKLYNPCGWYFQETLKVDVKLPLRWVLLSHGASSTFSPFMAAVFRMGGGRLMPWSHSDFWWYPNEWHVQVLAVNKQPAWNLFVLLAPFSSDSNVSVQRNEVSNGFLQLPLPFTDIHGIWRAILNMNRNACDCNCWRARTSDGPST